MRTGNQHGGREYDDLQIYLIRRHMKTPYCLSLLTFTKTKYVFINMSSNMAYYVSSIDFITVMINI